MRKGKNNDPPFEVEGFLLVQEQSDLPKTKSKGEKAVDAHLRRRGLCYSRETRYHGCCDIKELPFDFQVVIDGRVGVIEFDGEQHFKRNTRYHKTPADFERTKRHDRTKTQYVHDHQISLLRIAYKQENEIPVWVDRFVAEMRSGRTVYLFSDETLYRDQSALCRSGSGCAIM